MDADPVLATWHFCLGVTCGGLRGEPQTAPLAEVLWVHWEGGQGTGSEAGALPKDGVTVMHRLLGTRLCSPSGSRVCIWKTAQCHGEHAGFGAANLASGQSGLRVP